MAKPEHPALIDEAHLLDELLGVVNVPSGVWIDEQGTIVRPPEPAFPGRAVIAELPMPPEAPPRIVEMMQEAREDARSTRRATSLRCATGPTNGADSRVRARTRMRWSRAPAPRPPEASRAAACFELGQHLHRAAMPTPAVPWFREAHRLQPGQLDLQAPGLGVRRPDHAGTERAVRRRLAQRRAGDRRGELLPAGRPLAAARCAPACSPTPHSTGSPSG